MSWVTLDDRAPAHPKLVRAGAEAAWLWASSLAFCNAHHTDGLVPSDMVSTLYSPLASKAAKLAERLVAVGLWERDGADFRVHDYVDYQASALKERAKAKTRARVAKHRARSGEPSGNADVTLEPVTRETVVTLPYPILSVPVLSEPSQDTALRVVAPPDAAALVRIGYVRRYGDKLASTPSPKSLATHVPPVAQWVRENAPLRKVSESALTDQLLDGLFARADLAEKRWPLSFVGTDPLEFLSAASNGKPGAYAGWEVVK